MHINHRSGLRRLIAGTAALGLGLALAACSDNSKASGTDGGAVGVALITKDSVNPFFVAMQNGAKKAAADAGVDLTLAAGAEDGDEEGQVQAIEDAIARGDKGILITPNGPGVNNAIQQARAAGLYVIALDTPPDPADTVDITFATDNFLAGQLIGQWTAGTLAGEPAHIAMLDLFNDKVVTVDYNRDQGFLDGLGIDVADPHVNGDEAASGTYTAGDGGDYSIVCNEPTNGNSDGGRTAMETCLSKGQDINVVYTINEPAAVGAYAALKAVGKEKGVIIVSVDGGCAGVASVKEGVIGATSQQYPLKMASMGVEAIAALVADGSKPSVSDGLDFFNTGVNLVTDHPVAGVDSIDTTEGTSGCWG